MQAFGLGDQMGAEFLAGREEDVIGLTWKYQGAIAAWWGGVTLLWIAAILTLVTGWDYFQKSLPFLKEPT